MRIYQLCPKRKILPEKTIAPTLHHITKIHNKCSVDKKANYISPPKTVNKEQYKFITEEIYV